MYLLQKWLKNNSYVILLIIITFICGLIYVHILTSQNSTSTDKNEQITVMNEVYETGSKYYKE